MNKRGVTVSPKTAEILEQMGEQIKLARLSRRLCIRLSSRLYPSVRSRRSRSCRLERSDD